jgi:hypothetical protein
MNISIFTIRDGLVKTSRSVRHVCVVSIYEHASCFAYYLIPTFRLVYIGVIFFSQEFIITCIFIYVRVCRCYLMLCPSILYDFWLPFWYLQTFLNLKTCTYVFMAIFYQGRKYSHLIPTFRLVYIGVIFFSHELIITCIFIYVRVCLFLYSAHIEIVHNPSRFVFKSIPQPQVTVYLTF